VQPAGTDPLLGRVLEGRYRIRAQIAVGGMSTVYAAVDERLDREVAVKVMMPSLSRDPVFIARFAREARSAAKLSHVNAVAVYDQGADAGSVFLVMELVRGRTLRDLIRERGALSPGEAVSLMEPVLAALAAAHRAGLVHRDVKPENILLSDDGLVKVADFGLARAVETNAASTRTGLMMGTVAYSSPEQFRRGNADARSDVYSAGVVLFELLTGRQPHSGPDAMAVAYRHVHEDIAAPSTFQRGVSPVLDRLIARVTARDPDRRPADAAAFLAELHDVRRELRLPVMPVPRRVRMPRAGAEVPAPAGPSTARTEGVANPAPAHTQPEPGRNGPRRLGPEGAAGAPVAVQHTLVANPGTGRPNPPQPNAAYPDNAALNSARPDGGPPNSARPDRARPNSVRANSGPGAPPAPRPGSVGVNGPSSPSAPRRRKRRWLRTLVGALVLLLVAAGITAGTWWFVAGRWSSIPDVRQFTVGRATSTLKAAGFRVAEGPGQASESVPKGAVISTQPPPGHRLVHGRTVRLTASTGKTFYAVPDVVGDARTSAATTLAPLADKGIRINYTTRADDVVADGKVISTSPKANSTLTRTGTITVVVSTGLPIVTVPNATGVTQDAATQTLKAAKFRVTTTTAFSDTVESGSVISQDPPEGAKVRKFSPVALVISKGADLVTVPPLTSLEPVAEATTALQSAGLQVRIQRSFGGSNGLVVGMDPRRGTKVKRGTVVTLYVI
jgi:beta-lactam-binding protein with PASTA domain/serine/threonine protein kinase